MIYYTKKVKKFKASQLMRTCQMEFVYWLKKNIMAFNRNQYLYH